MLTNSVRASALVAVALLLSAALFGVSCRSTGVTYNDTSSYSSIAGAQAIPRTQSARYSSAGSVQAVAFSPAEEPRRLPRLRKAKVQKVEHNTEAYDAVEDNPFQEAKREPLSTFAADVDTASYANVRRMITNGQDVPRGAARIEEMVNYFSYEYPQPSGKDPVSIHTELAACPWAEGHELVRIGLRARDIDDHDRPAANLVFLLDVSGSMQSPDKLPLLKRSLKLLVDELEPRDHIAITVYASASGMVLEPTPCSQKAEILAALDGLEAGGSTN